MVRRRAHFLLLAVAHAARGSRRAFICVNHRARDLDICRVRSPNVAATDGPGRMTNSRMRLLALLACGLVATGRPGDAGTPLLWNWSYSGAGISASGTITTGDTATAAGRFLITGITGSRNGVAIVGLQPTGT